MNLNADPNLNTHHRLVYSVATGSSSSSKGGNWAGDKDCRGSLYNKQASSISFLPPTYGPPPARPRQAACLPRIRLSIALSPSDSEPRPDISQILLTIFHNYTVDYVNFYTPSHHASCCCCCCQGTCSRSTGLATALPMPIPNVVSIVLLPPRPPLTGNACFCFVKAHSRLQFRIHRYL